MTEEDKFLAINKKLDKLQTSIDDLASMIAVSTAVEIAQKYIGDKNAEAVYVCDCMLELHSRSKDE